MNDRLSSLATARGVHFVPMKAEWYGVDPIHIRPVLWHPAWQHILGFEASSRSSKQDRLEGMSLYFMRPERQWLFGVEQVSRQTGTALPRGGKLWLF